jgi:homotetrameric cytidine deaminase
MNPSRTEELWKAACGVRLRAYAPYSQYQVGAALSILDSEEIFSGCNVENSSYGATICAERNAVLQAVAAYEGKPTLTEIVLVTRDPAPPCGMCLQVLSEFSTPQTRIVLSTPEKICHKHLLSDFLPLPFSPTSLKSHV